MHKEGVVILKILSLCCQNFNVDDEGKEKAVGIFQEHLPNQDRKLLRKSLLKIREDLKKWDADSGNGYKVIHDLYFDIGKSLKGVPGGKVGLAFAWGLVFKSNLKKEEYQPYINFTISQIRRELDGYAKG